MDVVCICFILPRPQVAVVILVLLGLVHAGLGVGFKVCIYTLLIIVLLHKRTLCFPFCSITTSAQDLLHLLPLLLPPPLDEYFYTTLFMQMCTF